MDPWRTLRRTADAAFAVLTSPDREVHVVREGGALAGFIILDVKGPLRGYIQTICVAPRMQGRGLGTFLIEWAERRIARESPNVFMSVSSFNPRARALYERLGYREVGTLKDYIVTGHDEILLRKTSGAWNDFRAKGT